MTQGFSCIFPWRSSNIESTELLCTARRGRRFYADFFFFALASDAFLSQGIIINILLYCRGLRRRRTQGNSHYHQKIAKPSILRGYSVSPNIAQSPQKNFSTLLHCSGLAIMMHCLPSRTVFSSSKTSFKRFSSRHISHQQAKQRSSGRTCILACLSIFAKSVVISTRGNFLFVRSTKLRFF